MQKCSPTTSPNNREVCVITGDLLAGLPPAGMPNRKQNSLCTYVTNCMLVSSETVYTKEAGYYSIIVCYTSSDSIAKIIKEVVLKLIHWSCVHL